MAFSNEERTQLQAVYEKYKDIENSEDDFAFLSELFALPYIGAIKETAELFVDAFGYMPFPLEPKDIGAEFWSLPEDIEQETYLETEFYSFAANMLNWLQQQVEPSERLAEVKAS